MKKICSVSKLNKTVRTGEVSQQLLKDIDLKIEDGEFVVIVGPSGAGKSTLLNILGGLDSSTSGDIESAGFRLSKSKEKTLNDYRRKIGFVFQDYSLIENLTVKENIEVMSVVTKKKCDADKALSLVGMKEHADKFPGQLSSACWRSSPPSARRRPRALAR